VTKEAQNFPVTDVSTVFDMTRCAVTLWVAKKVANCISCTLQDSLNATHMSHVHAGLAKLYAAAMGSVAISALTEAELSQTLLLVLATSALSLTAASIAGSDNFRRDIEGFIPHKLARTEDVLVYVVERRRVTDCIDQCHYMARGVRVSAMAVDWVAACVMLLRLRRRTHGIIVRLRRRTHGMIVRLRRRTHGMIVRLRRRTHGIIVRLRRRTHGMIVRLRRRTHGIIVRLRVFANAVIHVPLACFNAIFRERDSGAIGAATDGLRVSANAVIEVPLACVNAIFRERDSGASRTVGRSDHAGAVRALDPRALTHGRPRR
jgi:hypothetical protein